MRIFKELKKHLNGSIDMYSAYDDQIAPCSDCRHCWIKPTCRIEDKMQLLYRKIDDYDNVVILSPLYFSELSGPLLSMCSRFQYFWILRNFQKKELISKRKKGVLIIAGAGDGDTISAEQSADIIFHHLKTDCVAKLFSLATAVTPARRDAELLAKCQEVAEMLNGH